MSEPQPVDCPPEVADAILKILRESILLIRQAASADDAEFCAREANHIHNLPGLLRHYSDARLERYVTWARGGYTAEWEKRFGRPPTIFIPEWQRLEQYLNEKRNGIGM